MLILNSSVKGRVEKARFSSFVGKSTFSGVSLRILELQFIRSGSLTSVISLLKQISSEDFGSKS
jgi:hypothetical protein